ncbi:putative NADPH oxidase 5-like [Apostichopus japonicus]|uniref:Putative NADPH oxidase 5-like n=1 Tax=Stichopus japonicus TaxID=307972 RepID=A0A2G8KDT3_STIJA|nr:putative NADPH oxidase 5-like [Apostichopus japonicus]
MIFFLGTGLLDEDTFQRALLIWMSSQGTPYCDSDMAGATTNIIFSTIVGQSEDRVITIQELFDCLATNQEVLDHFECHFRAGGGSPKRRRPLISRLTPSFPRRYCTIAYVLHNQRKIYSVLLIILVSLLAFLWNAWKYIEDGQLVAVARGCGMALNVNSSLILIFMLRHSATHLRTSHFSKYLPLDHMVFLHKAVAWLIGFFALAHAVSHLVNVVNSCSSNCTPSAILSLCFVAKGDTYGLFSTTVAFLSGWVLLLIFLIMAITSCGYIRQRYHKIFKSTHLLFVPFLLILLFHGRNAWKWLLIPGLLFIFEKIISSRIVKRHRYGDTFIQRANILPNGVVHLVIERPSKFKFQPGDYIYMQIPELSSHEWHPFTISSAPENTDNISLHVRTLGDWTQQLLDYFKRTQNRRRSVCESFSPKKGKSLFSLEEDSSDDEADTDADDIELTTIANTSQNRKPISMYENENDSMVTFNVDSEPTCAPTLTVDDDNRVDNGSSHQSSLRPKKPLRRRVEFRTPDQDIPEIIIETPGTVETSLRSKRGRLGSPKKNVSSVASDSELVMNESTDIELDIVPAEIKSRRSRLVHMSSTQTSIDLKDECVNVVSTTDNDSTGLQVYVDGPYGTSTRRIFEADHVVMIAGGIGVTPFASVLQSIMYRFEQIPLNCPNCSHSWTVNRPKDSMKLKKVHFIWINRDRRNFEWFATLLTELDIAGQHYMGFEQFLDMQLYLTSEPDKNFLQDLALQLALERVNNQDSAELLAKLKEKTRYGRPDWDEVRLTTGLKI